MVYVPGHKRGNKNGDHTEIGTGERHAFMNEQNPPAEFLVICRGQWDSALSQDERQNAIDRFYAWFDKLVDQGKMKPGQRLTSEGRTIGRKSPVIDGPFGESKEVIGGYWFVLAQDLDEAAEIVKGDPCLDHGKLVEIRPIDSSTDSHGCWRNELTSAGHTE